MVLNKLSEFLFNTFMDSSSDEESEFMIVVAPPSSMTTLSGKSQCIRARRANAACNREASHYRLQLDYFYPTKPIFTVNMFRLCFWMSRNLFMTILRGVRDYEPYFRCKPRCH
jgi:hypothetical protein